MAQTLFKAHPSACRGWVVYYYEVSCNGDSVLVGKGLMFVHELQNLYFALTGEELTIK